MDQVCILLNIFRGLKLITIINDFRQQNLQFSPPMEEIRMKYYGQLKRFMAIPLNFRGVSDICIFPSIVDQ